MERQKAAEERARAQQTREGEQSARAAGLHVRRLYVVDDCVTGIEERRRVSAAGSGDVIVDELTDRPEVRSALDGIGGPARGGERREEDADQDGDDPDDDEDLD